MDYNELFEIAENYMLWKDALDVLKSYQQLDHDREERESI